jgi:hypothetical protein
MFLGSGLIVIIKFFMVNGHRKTGWDFDPWTLIATTALNKANSIIRVFTQTIG